MRTVATDRAYATVNNDTLCNGVSMPTTRLRIHGLPGYVGPDSITFELVFNAYANRSGQRADKATINLNFVRPAAADKTNGIKKHKHS